MSDHPVQPLQTNHPAESMQSQSIQIAVVGDIHGQWNDQDALALQALEVDLVLFVGDFGNEAIDLVEKIAYLPMPMAAVFGNHDAWYTATPWGRQKCPYDRSQEDWVQHQIESLGKAHVGYGNRDFPQLQLSVVGGRPFSWGGPEWKYADFYGEQFGVSGLEDSGDRILEAALRSQFESVIFLNHNGPTGLGDAPEAPCGRDWRPIGGDYGDPELEQAIQATKAAGKKIPLVTFGHMHHTLRHTRDYLRKRVCVDHNGTVYLNAACVPRILERNDTEYHNFSLVQIKQDVVVQVESVWVAPDGAIAEQEILFA